MDNIDRTLRRIASNLWFEWNSDVHSLFRSVSPYIWGLFRHNIYRFIKVQDENPLLYRHRLAQLMVDSHFHQLFEKVESAFNAYIHPQETFISKNYPELADKTVAYFSMEYGFNTLRTYSGGLGILSGDHLRGASDLGLKIVGVGLFYMQGYYEQQVSLNGEMKVIYEATVPLNKRVRDFLPLTPIRKPNSNEDLIIDVPVADRMVKVRIWKAYVGRAELLLLDTDLRENRVHDRHITRRLYASQKKYDEERRRRLEQEILLGIGGVKALQEIGYQPAVYHLNEGHVAFAALEVIRILMQRRQRTNFDDARKKAAQITGFTTHTPIPEGNERFDEGLVRQHIQPYLDGFLNPGERETIFNCARNRENSFDMTKLAMMLSGVFRNGVSKIHGEVCRKMWGYAWGNHDPSGNGVEIGHITNAVHVQYWQKPVLRQLIQKYGGLDSISDIPDDELWKAHLEFKSKLIASVRERFAFQMLREKVDGSLVYKRASNILDPNAFMIGFARRFADYKRVTMLLEDEEMLFQFLERAYRKYQMPINIVYGGKPHPDNYSGRNRIKQIVEISSRLQSRCEQRNFKAQIVFIQGYDIEIARYLEAGVEIWLNNPIKPLEASGTSGMKAGMNGVLNVSVADGWVPEGIVNGKNGWMFGKGDADSTEQDRRELFQILENEILPLYFNFDNRDKTYSSKWLRLMKNSIETITRQFNTDRMLVEYVDKMYLPAARQIKLQTV